MTALSSCSRCYGSGFIAIFSHVEGGVCFSCHGSGFVPKSEFKHLLSGRKYFSPNTIEVRHDWYKVEALKDGKRTIVLKYRSKNIESATRRARELVARDKSKLKHKGVDWASWRIL